MIYLTLDSDIWLNSLKESGEEDNPIDFLEYWIENNNITILLPEIIVAEWNRNREKKKDILISDWKTFFNRAKKVFSKKDVVSELMTPEKLNERVEAQLQKIENIFNNYALKIPITNDCKLKATGLAEEKKAPFRTKNSIGDAYIFLTLVEYVAINNLTNCIFITNNYTDFSLSDKDRDKIHPDLEPDFNRLGIVYYVDLRRFFHDFSKELPDYFEYKKLKLYKEEDKKLSFAILNPQTIDNLTGLRDSYIDNINLLDLIFKTKKPTKQQVSFTLDLLKSDDSYHQYFYKNIDGAFWFQILKVKGDFLPSENPLPIEFKDGFQIPYWDSLLYLEKISNQIKNGETEAIELIDEIINIIKTVSENPKDNHRTWYLFIKILSNLPNESIPIDTLNFIPIWLNGRFSTTLQSSEICGHLLPKFLNENPTLDDIKKAEIIIKHLLSLEKVEFFNEKHYQESYQSRVEMYYLKNTFTNQVILERVTKYCSSNVIIELADTIKKTRFYFSNSIITTIKTEINEYNIKTEISENDLIISILQNNELWQATIATTKVSNYEQLNKEEILRYYVDFFEKNSINYKETDDSFSLEDVVDSLMKGAYYIFSDSISKLGNEYYHDESPEEVLSLIFRDLLNKLAKTNLENALTLLKIFAFNQKYRLPFFQKIVLYVIGENWISFRELFLELISENDPKKLFSEYYYEKDLYELLDKNQKQISQVELDVIQKILDTGFQGDSKRYDEEYWKFRWYSALRTIPPYTGFYSILSKKYKETHEDIIQEDEVRFTAGDRSPMTTEEILEMTNDDIVNYIQTFKPKDRWEEPTISGFSDMLGKAIGIEPLNFSEGIEKYHEVYYIYAYHMANGFREAWKHKRSFNWRKVLHFFYSYIKDKKFYSGQFALENDGWGGATPEWVIDAIANLLTEGMQSDNNSFDEELLPMAKDILAIFIENLVSVDNVEETNMDYPTYSLNSTGGKVLRAWLDYALRIGRNNFSKESNIKWNDETKEMFESACQKGIIDTYILTGLYFQQFYFLDKDWISSKIKEYYKLEEKYWLAFVGGFVFSNPLSNKTIYELFYPHYERVINNDVKIKSFFQRGIIRHIVAFYFWGFEDLKNGLLSLILEKDNHGHILELVNFIWRQEKYILSLKNKEEIEKFEKIIFELWTLLANKYENAVTEEEQKVLVALSNLLELAPELNENYMNLVLKSMKIPDKDFHTHYLIENLLKMKTKGEPNDTAKYIGTILNSIQFTPYFSSIDSKHIIELVDFLYKNEQKHLANDFCNKMVKQGQEFLKDIYNQNQ